MNEKMKREDELIARVRAGLTGRTVAIEGTAYGKREYAIARVAQGISYGSHRQHVTLYYVEDGHEFDFAEMYPETAMELLNNGVAVMSSRWRFTLK